MTGSYERPAADATGRRSWPEPADEPARPAAGAEPARPRAGSPAAPPAARLLGSLPAWRVPALRPDTAEQVRAWGRILGAALGVAALAGAGQLGIAYGLGLVWFSRRPFGGGAVWSSQLAWVAWFAILAVLAGAVAGSRMAARHERTLEFGTRVAVALAAAAGAAVVVPLTALPARAAQLTSGDPASWAAAAAGLGVVAGVFGAVAAMSHRLVAANLALTVAVTWLFALVSVAPLLSPTAPLPRVRLGVLDLPAFGAGTAVGVLTAPVLALLIGGGIAAAARSRGLPPLPAVLSGLAGPGLLALAYLIAGPGGTTAVDRSLQLAPFWGALLAVAAGLLATLLVSVVRTGALRHGALRHGAHRPGSAGTAAGGDPGPDSGDPGATRWPETRITPVGDSYSGTTVGWSTPASPVSPAATTEPWRTDDLWPAASATAAEPLAEPKLLAEPEPVSVAEPAPAAAPEAAAKREHTQEPKAADVAKPVDSATPAAETPPVWSLDAGSPGAEPEAEPSWRWSPPADHSAAAAGRAPEPDPATDRAPDLTPDPEPDGPPAPWTLPPDFLDRPLEATPWTRPASGPEPPPAGRIRWTPDADPPPPPPAPYDLPQVDATVLPPAPDPADTGPWVAAAAPLPPPGPAPASPAPASPAPPAGPAPAGEPAPAAGKRRRPRLLRFARGAAPADGSTVAGAEAPADAAPTPPAAAATAPAAATPDRPPAWSDDVARSGGGADATAPEEPAGAPPAKAARQPKPPKPAKQPKLPKPPKPAAPRRSADAEPVPPAEEEYLGWVKGLGADETDAKEDRVRRRLRPGSTDEFADTEFEPPPAPRVHRPYV